MLGGGGGYLNFFQTAPHNIKWNTPYYIIIIVEEMLQMSESTRNELKMLGKDPLNILTIPKGVLVSYTKNWVWPEKCPDSLFQQ